VKFAKVMFWIAGDGACWCSTLQGASIHQQSPIPSSSTVLRGRGGVVVGDRWIMRVRQLSSSLDKQHGRSNECLGANALP